MYFTELKVYVRCCSGGWMTFVMNCVNYIVNDIHARCQGDEFGLHAYEQGAFAGT